MAIAVSVTLENRGDGFMIDVLDNGPAMSEALRSGLFVQPVASANGLGIGLYQAHQLATRSALTLALVENRDGAVRFRLARSAADSGGPADPEVTLPA